MFPAYAARVLRAVGACQRITSLCHLPSAIFGHGSTAPCLSVFPVPFLCNASVKAGRVTTCAPSCPAIGRRARSDAPYLLPPDPPAPSLIGYISLSFASLPPCAFALTSLFRMKHYEAPWSTSLIVMSVITSMISRPHERCAGPRRYPGREHSFLAMGLRELPMGDC
jgi:hypothetical protein